MKKNNDDLEHTFNLILTDNELKIGGMFFRIKDKILTCNCIIDNYIIILIPKITHIDEEKIKEFKKIHTQYKIIVFTEDTENVLILESADEIYTLEDKKKFEKFIKEII